MSGRTDCLAWLLAGALSLGATSASLAQPPAAAQAAAVSANGDWVGDLNNPPIVYRLGLHIDETAPGVFSGTVGSHETGRFGTPLANVTFTDGVLSFAIPTSGASFRGTWDAAASAWTGTYTLRTGAIPMSFKRGALPPLAPVAGLDGRWEGTLENGGMRLRLALRIADGKTALLDSPDQMQTGILATALRRDGAAVSVVVPSIQGRFAGSLAADGETLTGTWNQPGASTPLSFKRMSASAALAPLIRPQVPAKPYPYKEEEVAYANPKAPGVRLGCTLTTPNGAGPHPAALLITGSGAQDRNESLFGHQPFLVLADALTRKGVAVLRCDDRGVGRTTGRFDDSTITAVATDVEAGLAYLRARPDIDPKKIGLIGHSEGGITGPVVAARDPDVAYLVMLAGIGVKVVDVMVEQGDMIARVSGVSEAQRATNRVTNRTIYELVLAAPDAATALAGAKRELMATGMTERAAENQSRGLTSGIFREFFGYDPAGTLPKVKVPVLAINGSVDVQVSAKQNLPGIRTLLAGNPDVTVVELPGLNHLFQTAKTGAPTEYGEIEETFSPAALALVSDWVAKRTGR